MFGINRCTPLSLTPTGLNAFVSLTQAEAWYVFSADRTARRVRPFGPPKVTNEICRLIRWPDHRAEEGIQDVANDQPNGQTRSLLHAASQSVRVVIDLAGCREDPVAGGRRCLA
jgi:hypothetical protein